MLRSILPTMTPARNISSLDLEAVYNELASKAAKAFNESGRLAPVLLVVSLAAEGVIADIDKLPDAFTLALQVQAATAPEALLQLAKSLLEPDSPMREQAVARGLPRPDLVVHISEAWVVFAENEEDLPDSLEEHAKRREAVQIALHTAGSSYFTYLLVDEQSRQAKVEPFNPLELTSESLKNATTPPRRGRPQRTIH